VGLRLFWVNYQLYTHFGSVKLLSLCLLLYVNFGYMFIYLGKLRLIVPHFRLGVLGLLIFLENFGLFFFFLESSEGLVLSKMMGFANHLFHSVQLRIIKFPFFGE
jgi:hypothetical protein